MKWLSPALSRVLDLADPGVWGPEDKDIGVSVLRSTNFNNDGTLDLENLSLRNVPARKLPEKLLMPGDIVLERSGGGPKQPVGRVCYFTGSTQPHSFGNFCQRLRAHSRCCDSKYLFWHLYWLHQSGKTSHLQKQTHGIRNLEYRRYLAQDVPLPPPSEQRRIVEILDQADALRKKRAEADAKAARILPALFYKMFGDPLTNPKGWPVVRLDDLGTPLSGGGFPLDEQGLTEGEVAFVKVSDMNTPGNEVFIRSANHWVSKETLRRLRVKPAPAGTTIFPKIGAAVATNKKRLLVRETAYDNNVIGVIPVTPEWSTYIFAFFLMFDLRRLTRTTALPSIKTSELVALPMAKPDSGIVQAFDKQFRQLLSLGDLERRSSEHVNSLFHVLLHRTFTGDLTAKWREAHMKGLLAEMEAQARELKIDDCRSPIELPASANGTALTTRRPHRSERTG